MRRSATALTPTLCELALISPFGRDRNCVASCAFDLSRAAGEGVGCPAAFTILPKIATGFWALRSQVDNQFFSAYRSHPQLARV
jgi:hypothetical protein